MKNLAKCILLFLLGLAIWGCSIFTSEESMIIPDNDTPLCLSWEEYRSIMVKEFDGKFLVEGDLVFESEEAVRAFFNSNAGIEDERSTGHLIGNLLDRWNSTEKRNLTYRVINFSNARTNQVINESATATARWERVADINFTRRANTGSSLFIIRPATSREERENRNTNASAFFPHQYTRELVLYNRFFSNNFNNRQRILLHELGHILGLRHEQFWFYGSLESNIAPLTYHDTASVMYSTYAINNPRYRYTGNGDVSAGDTKGVQVLYNMPYETVPFYRYYNRINGDHFYTSSWNELGNGRGGYIYEGITGYLNRRRISGTYPLYRYYNTSNGDHFYTRSWSELGGGRWGYIYEGVAGYVYASRISGTAPVYRYYNTSNGDHFYTLSWSELGSGRWNYIYEGIACYIRY